MDAISMQNKMLLDQLRTAYPKFRFISDETYAWLPEQHAICYREEDPDTSQLFHELAHALLGHHGYDRDIALLAIERDAWHLAENLAVEYGVIIDEDTREDAMDSYRDWLHARSLCPQCGVNGVQVTAREYHCFMCQARWSVNDARICGLKRTLIKK